MRPVLNVLSQHTLCEYRSVRSVYFSLYLHVNEQKKKKKINKNAKSFWELQTCQGHMQMSEKSGFVMHSYKSQTNLSAPTHHSCGQLFVFCWEQLPPADKRYQDFHLWSSSWLIFFICRSENWVVFQSGLVTGVKKMYNHEIIMQKSLSSRFFSNAQLELPAMSQ